MPKNDLRFGNKQFKRERDLQKYLKGLNQVVAKKKTKSTNMAKKAAWWNSMSKKARAAYIKKHPRSKFAKFVNTGVHVKAIFK